MVKLSPQIEDKATKRLLAAREWFATAKGQRLLGCEQPIINKALYSYLGRCGLHYGPLSTVPEEIAAIKDFYYLGAKGVGADVICEEKAWPIFTDGVEIVVLQHALEFAKSPHDVLREAARCVRPGGHLLIVGFNPFSLWGGCRCFGSLRRTHNITHWRLLDWLKLLGFRVEKQWKGGYFPPLKTARCQKLFAKIERVGQRRRWYGNAFYVVSARKLMMQTTPLVVKKKLIFGKFVPCPATNRSDVKSDEREN